MRNDVMIEADTCREFVTPRLVEAGWGVVPHTMGEQRRFSNRWIIAAGGNTGLEHTEPNDLIAAMRSHEAEVQA
jgi:type I site-specific restriction endonuclease